MIGFDESSIIVDGRTLLDYDLNDVDHLCYRDGGIIGKIVKTEPDGGKNCKITIARVNEVVTDERP